MGFAVDTQHQAFKFQPFQEKKKKKGEKETSRFGAIWSANINNNRGFLYFMVYIILLYIFPVKVKIPSAK